MSGRKPEIVGNYEILGSEAVTRREVLILGAAAATTLYGAAGKAASPGGAGTGAAPYLAKEFGYLLGKGMDGFSANQLKQHFQLYNGYVTKSNSIRQELKQASLEGANATFSPFRELLVEESYALNGVVYHELYFGNLGGEGGEPAGELEAAIGGAFGSAGKFMDYLKAAGKAARGWVVVGYNLRIGEICAYALDLHNLWVPAAVVPLLVLDVYEHAYMIDYGIDRGAYLDAFVKNLDWKAVSRRFSGAIKHRTGLDCTA